MIGYCSALTRVDRLCDHHWDGENRMTHYQTLSLRLAAGKACQGRGVQGRGRGQGV